MQVCKGPGLQQSPQTALKGKESGEGSPAVAEMLVVLLPLAGRGLADLWGCNKQHREMRTAEDEPLKKPPLLH